MKAAIKKIYKLHFYHFFKGFERDLRKHIFKILTVVPSFNAFRWFKIPLKTERIEEDVVESLSIQLRKSPQTVESSIPVNFEVLKLTMPTAGIALVKNGFSTVNACNLTGKGSLIENFTEQFTALNIENNRLFNFRLSRVFQPIEHFDQTVMTLTVDGQTNYFHWLFDVLPKIHLVRKKGLHPELYYADQSRPFQKQSFEYLGIKESQIIDPKKHPIISATELIVSSFPCLSGIPHWACQFLNSTFADSKVEPDLKIFISRSGADYRRILNEKELIPLLLDHGFKIVQCEKLSFLEQVEIFSRAKTILSPHGAGLANLVFCKPGTKVIEIFAPRFPCSCYWSLSNVMNLDYQFILAENDPITYSHECEGYDEIFLDITRLAKIAAF